MEAKGIATIHYQGKGIVVASGNLVNKRHKSPSGRIRFISKIGNPPMPADALVNQVHQSADFSGNSNGFSPYFAFDYSIS